MQKAQLFATLLGAATLAIGAAQAGQMAGGPASGMGVPPAAAAGLNGTINPNASTDTCGDNAATRIPCAHSKAKAKSKDKAAASADLNGANANAKTGAAASTGSTAPGAGANPSASGATDPMAGASPPPAGTPPH